MIALFASSYGAVFAGAFALAALVAGATLGAAWDRAHAWLNPNGAHRR